MTPCPKRQKLTIINQQGDSIAMQQCTELQCEQFAKFVTPDVCDICLVRESVLQKHIQNTPPKPDRTNTSCNTCKSGPIISDGPGTHLGRIIDQLGMRPTSICNCVARGKQMDVWGVAGCQAHHAEIVAWLKEAFKHISWSGAFKGYRVACRAGWFRTLAPFESLLDEAIRRAGV